MEASELSIMERPKGVWLISGFFFLSAGYSLLSFALVFSGKIVLSDAQKAYFDSLTVFEYVLTVAFGIANLAGAVSLLLLRKVAFTLFLGSFLIAVAMCLWHAISTGWVAAFGGLGTIIWWGIFGAVLTYIRNLIRAGVLR